MTNTGLLIAGLGAAVALSAQMSLAQTAEAPADQWAAYDAVQAKSILDLQPFRSKQQATDPDSGQEITLISLNPATDAWYLLQLRISPDGPTTEYHLENADAAQQEVSLQTNGPPALVLESATGRQTCAPWENDSAELATARDSGLAYAPVCDGALYLRNRVTGARTNIEATTDFLRDNIWGGESIVRFVRDNFFKDSALETSDLLDQGGVSGASDGPAPMKGRVPAKEQPEISTLLDIALEGREDSRMVIGQWYPVAGLDGVFASTFQPRAISEEIFQIPGANRLDGIEAKATGYMIAFDLGLYDMGYAVGTDHPALGWSSRPPTSIRPRGLPGPDGIDKPKPLVALGMVNPEIADRAVATFTAGFKRQHGAFRFGDMATVNLGHHYGFIEKGVIFSKLQPNLSTLYGLTDGTIAMKTWQEADNALLPQIAFARQNGVPLVMTDPETGRAVPGDRVTKWGPGNWSGSAEAELRTLRAGACMASSGGRDYLIYGYFSTATPSAMARTFLAYGCDYAMLLDMNALEHTYLALYVPKAEQMHVAHLVPGMALIEKKARDGTILPRFIGFADNRDLFYVTRKESQP